MGLSENYFFNFWMEHLFQSWMTGRHPRLKKGLHPKIEERILTETHKLFSLIQTHLKAIPNIGGKESMTQKIVNYQ